MSYSFKQILDNIAAVYVDGCAEFYCNMKNDPWQAAHDEYEKFILAAIDDPSKKDEEEKASEVFEHRILKLIELYKQLKEFKPKVSPAMSGFWLGIKEELENESRTIDEQIQNIESAINTKK